jgi:uncharacterized protein (DUF2147 family)
MKKYSFLVVFISLIISNLSFSQNRKSDEIIGKWLTENGEAKVEIFKVGEKYYGKIIWLKDPYDKETGNPKTDKHNPDPKLKSRPILGLIIVSGFIFDGSSQWEDGTIYDAKSGKTYNCYINFESNNKIKVRGYIGKSWMGLGRTTYWSRTN